MIRVSIVSSSDRITGVAQALELLDLGHELLVLLQRAGLAAQNILDGHDAIIDANATRLPSVAGSPGYLGRVIRLK